MREQQIQSVCQYVDLHKTEMISLLEEFVKLPSCSREPEVMPAATAWVTDLLRREGFAVRTWDVGHSNAPVIVADLDGQNGAAPVVFSGHYDTALPRALSEQNPFRSEEGKI